MQQRKDSNTTIAAGVLVQTRFERVRYPEVVAAARADGLPITAWIRNLVYRTIAAQKNRKPEI